MFEIGRLQIEKITSLVEAFWFSVDPLSLLNLIFFWVDIQKVFRSGPLHPQPRVRNLLLYLSYDHYIFWVDQLFDNNE